MRKFLYSIGIASFLAMLIFTIASSLSNPFSGMSEEALAQGSSLATTGEIVCHCTWFGKCKASGGGNNCASGDNINCQDWNGNC